MLMLALTTYQLSFNFLSPNTKSVIFSLLGPSSGIVIFLDCHIGLSSGGTVIFDRHILDMDAIQKCKIPTYLFMSFFENVPRTVYYGHTILHASIRPERSVHILHILHIPQHNYKIM